MDGDDQFWEQAEGNKELTIRKALNLPLRAEITERVSTSFKVQLSDFDMEIKVFGMQICY